MGTVTGIDAENFPSQGTLLNQPVSVCFHYNTSKRIPGQVVRDDVDSPYITIIRLIDGRYILATECQFHLIQLPVS